MNLQKSTPELRFPKFKNKWTKVNLSQILKVTMGQSPSSENYNKNKNGIPLIQGNADLKNRKTSPRIWTSQITKEADHDDLILCVRAPSGIIAKSKHNVCIGRGVASLKIKKDNNTEFFFQQLIKKEKKWLKYEQGSTFKAINSNDIRKFKLYRTSLEEQKKIATFLSLVDKKIELLQKQKSTLEKYKKGLMQQIFSQQIRFKDENGNDFPEWETLKFKKIIQEIKKEKELSPDDFYQLTVKLHTKGIVNSYKKPRITKKGRPYYKRYEGEFIVGRQNFHNGGFGFVNKKTSGLVASNAISSYEFKNICDPKYFYYYISRRDYHQKVGHILGGTGQKEISKKEFLNLKIQLPKIREQKKISTLLKITDLHIYKRKQVILRFIKFKKSLLQKMFI